MTENSGSSIRWFLAALVLSAAYPYLRLRGAAVSAGTADGAFLSFDTSRFVLWAGGGVLIGIVFAILLFRCGSSVRRSLATSAVLLFLLNAWLPMNEMVEALLGTLSLRVAWVQTILVLALLAGVLVETWRLSEWAGSGAVMSVALATMCAFSLWNFRSGRRTVPESIATVSISNEVEPGVRGGDVYFVVVDGYGGQEELSRFAGFDNAPFIHFLESQGFDVIDNARSSYSHTVFSIASMVGLTEAVASGPFEAGARVAAIEAIAGSNPLFDGFSRAGYEIVLIENSWSIAECDSSRFTCVRTSLIDEFDWALLQNTPIPSLWPNARVHPWARAAVQQIKELRDLPASPDSQPRLVFAHILIPHAPFNLTADCGYQTAENLGGYNFTKVGVSNAVRQEGFSDQISCLNALIESFLIGVDPNATVVITGDHGTGFQDQARRATEDWGVDSILERFSIILAIRMPAFCSDDVAKIDGPIDAARAIAKCALGLELDMEPNHQYIVSYRSDGGGVITPAR